MGFKSQIISIESMSLPTSIKLEVGVSLEAVEITSEYSRLKQELGLTVESIGLREIRSFSKSSFYDALASRRETDLMTVSFRVKIVNTRGIHSSTPIQSLQLIDGVDNASPGLNYPLGNFMGLAKLEVEGVPLVSLMEYSIPCNLNYLKIRSHFVDPSFDECNSFIMSQFPAHFRHHHSRV